jgi:hypothetical protein
VSRADELVDRSLLQELAFRYAAAVDTCDRDAFLAVFDPEGSISAYAPDADEPFAVQRGHAELAMVPGMMRQRFHRTQHMMTNHLVDLTRGAGGAGHDATGSVYCTARHWNPDPLGGTDLIVVIRYDDSYRRDGDGWRILDRHIRFLFSETVSTLTAAQAVMA